MHSYQASIVTTQPAEWFAINVQEATSVMAKAADELRFVMIVHVLCKVLYLWIELLIEVNLFQWC